MGRPKIGDGSSTHRALAMTDETWDQLNELVAADRASSKGLTTRSGYLRTLIDREWKKLQRKTAGQTD